MLYSFLIKLTKSVELTEDVIQDVFIKLWHNRALLDGIAEVDAYLITLAKNRALNAFKRATRERFFYDTQEEGIENGTDERLILNDTLKRVGKAVENLPPQQRLVYVLSREKFMKRQEIADHLKISSSTVNNHLMQALRTLRKTLNSFFW